MDPDEDALRPTLPAIPEVESEEPKPFDAFESGTYAVFQVEPRVLRETSTSVGISGWVRPVRRPGWMIRRRSA